MDLVLQRRANGAGNLKSVAVIAIGPANAAAIGSRQDDLKTRDEFQEFDGGVPHAMPTQLAGSVIEHALGNWVELI